MRILVPIIVAAAALPVCAASARPAAQTLSFHELLHGSTRIAPPLRLPLGTSPLVIDSPEEAAGESDFFLGGRLAAAINQTDWRRQFVVGLFSTWATRGYDVAVRRITLQHIGGGAQQLCVVAALHQPAPGRVVLQERTSAYDVVRVQRRPTNLVAPSSVVVRGVHGRLLYATKDDRPLRPDVCRAA